MFQLFAAGPAFVSIAAFAQPTTAPEFDAASVKRASLQDAASSMQLPTSVREQIGFEGGPGTSDPGRIHYHGVSLMMLLVRAYNLKPDQISGPDWLDEERYTIDATLPPGASAEQLRLMLQKVLIDRFHIGLHRETKEVPVYRLMIAKNGPKLNPPEPIPHYDTKEEWAAATKEQLLRSLKDLQERQASGERGSRDIGFASATTEKFASSLSAYLDRPVKDATQLEGNYSFHVHWVIPKDASYEGPGPDIFAAVQEQLGLKLEPTKDFLESLVLDKVDKVPAEN